MASGKSIARMTGPHGARTDRLDYFRLVLPGEFVGKNDEQYRYGTWHDCTRMWDRLVHQGIDVIYRRRVTVRPKSQRKGGGGR